MRRRVATATAVIAGAIVLVPQGGAAPGMVFGFSDDAPKWYGDAAVSPARLLGARSFRLTLQWKRGQSKLDREQRGALSQAVRSVVARGLGVVLSVYGESGAATPLSPDAREDYCRFVRSAIARYPAINDVVIWNEPNAALFWRPQFGADGTSAAPAAYEALLARCYDLLHAFKRAINVVAPATAPHGNDQRSHSPGSFIRGLGDAYRASLRTRPLFDTVAHHVYGDSFSERPWRRHPDSKTIAEGDWNKLMWNLARAFAGTAQPIPGQCVMGRCTSIWYLESGFQTEITPASAKGYTGSEVSPDTIPASAGAEPHALRPLPGTAAPDQSMQIADAVRLAYCQPYVARYHNFLLRDETRLEGWQSGPLSPDGTAKSSLFAFLDVVGAVNAGMVDCASVNGVPPSDDYVPSAVPADVSGQIVATRRGRQPQRAFTTAGCTKPS